MSEDNYILNQALPQKYCSNCGMVLDEGAEFCSKCGEKIGINASNDVKDKIEIYNNTRTEKNSRSKKRIFVLVGVVITLLILAFAWCLFRSGWSLKQLQKIISEEHYACFIEHDIEEPNCLHGYYCKKCGYEYGDIAGHTWAEATCTEPKTCDVCGKVEGEALGHSTGFGVCDICGEFSYELQSEYKQISTYMSDASTEFNLAVGYLKSAAQSRYLQSYYVEQAQVYLENAKQDFKEAITVCGSYSEFEDVKVKISAAANAINTTSSSYMTLATAAETSLEYAMEATDLLMELMEQ